MKYQEALNYLDSFFNLEKLSHYTYSRELKLERMRELLKVFDSPQEEFKAIHIAGSKGKGTTAAGIYQILKEQGYKVGLYTSPHLISLRERIRFSDNHTEDPLGFGDTISEEELADLVEEVKTELDNFSKNSRWGKPTFFEVYTLLAFLYFARKKVDLAVLETGLGGRLDATNLCNPILTAITKILYEHTDKLGTTITEIANEKAGIIKENLPVIVGVQKYEEAIKVMEEKAREKRARIYRIGNEIKFITKENSFDVEIDGYKYADLKTNLSGNFQKENLAISVSMAHLLNETGYKIEEEKIRQALFKIYWPGRFQIVKKQPVIIFDSAHNPESIEEVGREVRKIYPDLGIISVLAISKDKDIEGILKEIIKFSSKIYLPKIEHIRLSAPATLAEVLNKLGFQNYEIDELPHIMEMVDKRTEKVILFTGSIFLLAETFKLLQKCPQR